MNDIKVSEKLTESTPAVSVTVPIYNTSQYLRQCLDSLAAQTLKNIEFILVDDGSSDGSGDICDEYAATDSRFKVIHQVNGGSASARQTGLDNSEGEYIIVCDSDDWVEPDMYEKLYHKAVETDADIICCGYFSEYSDKTIMNCSNFSEENKLVLNSELIKSSSTMSVIKLIKKSLFSKTHASYEPGINLSEDGLILYKLLKGNPLIVQIEDALYHYRRQYGSSSYTNTLRMSSIKQLTYTYKWFSANYNEPFYEDIVFKFATSIVFACLRSCDLDKKFLKSFLKSDLPFKTILTHRFTLKSLLSLSAKILPITIIQKSVKLIYPYVYK